MRPRAGEKQAVDGRLAACSHSVMFDDLIARHCDSDRREHRGDLKGMPVDESRERGDHAWLFRPASNLGDSQRSTRAVKPNDRLLLA